MLKVNTNDIEELTWSSPKGKFSGAGKQVSEALGRDPDSTDLMVRHPFDVEIMRLAPGEVPYPYHMHASQWEFYHVISGSGTVRHAGGVTEFEAGDAFVFKPGEPHQLRNTGAHELVVYVVADNPIGDNGYLPDSDKFFVRAPERRLIRGQTVEFFDGEE